MLGQLAALGRQGVGREAGGDEEGLEETREMGQRDTLRQVLRGRSRGEEQAVGIDGLGKLGRQIEDSGRAIVIVPLGDFAVDDACAIGEVAPDDLATLDLHLQEGEG